MTHLNLLVQIFCRSPVEGQVKTRLIPALGSAGALSLYEQMISRTMLQVEQTRLPAELWVTDPDHPWFEDAGLPIYPQSGDDLGARMSHSLQAGLRRARSVILIGVDLPPVDTGYLELAASRLGDHDVVLGPAEDGGYGLIGVTGKVPPVFTDMQWGSDHVLADTCRRLNHEKFHYALLPLVWDVDRPEDLARYQAFMADEVTPRPS